MILTLPNTSDHYKELLSINEEDEIVKSYFMMGSYWPIFILMTSYLYFVLKLGPSLMANRKPFQLTYVMILYNIFQVVANAWFLFWIIVLITSNSFLFSGDTNSYQCFLQDSLMKLLTLILRQPEYFNQFFSKDNIFSYLLQQSCYPTPRSNVPLRLFALKTSWIWLLLKLSDLVDTVFFVLRKKDKQISFLHVYHHTSIVLSVWMYLMYVRGEQGIMIGLINSPVHVIMYGYYLLSAAGPQVQRYLWWKKYITWLQLLQFWILTAFFSILLLSCRVPPIQQAYNYYAVSQGVGFTWLFLRFYWKSYSQEKELRTTKND